MIETKTISSPKLEVEIEYEHREDKLDEDEEKEFDDDHHDNDEYEILPENQCDGTYNKEDTNEDEDEDDEDKPLIKYFPPRRQKKPKPPITLMCNICGNLFKNKATFNYHMKLHRNDKKYECE